jgi:hypothetical protein
MSGAPAAADAPAVPTGWLRLECRPGKVGNHLLFPYQLTNGGPLPVLVMDAWQQHHQDAEAPHAEPDLAQVTLRGDGIVVVGKYVPALPAGMRMVVPNLPLCLVLKPGETLTRELRVNLPLAEQSPYVPEALISRYEPFDLRGLILAIGWWPLNQKGLVAAPWPHSAEHHIVSPLARLPPAGTAQQGFPLSKLEMLKRRDPFPRTFPVHPELARERAAVAF